jgi:hypothetical protein
MPSQIVTPPSVEPVSLAEARSYLRVDADVTSEDALITDLIAAARQDAEKITWRALVMQTWRATLDRFPGPGANSAGSTWVPSSYAVMPGPVLTAVPQGKTGYEIFLPKPPLVTVNSIKYIDQNGVQQTLATDQYLVDTVSEPGRVTPAYGTSWPSTREQANAVEVSFNCGYASKITADATANTITPTLWPTLAVNDAAVFSNSGGALPAPLAAGTTYYVQSVVSAGVYKFSATVGGAAIDLTDAGSGTSFIGAVPEGIKRWMRVRVNTIFENREEVALLNRGKIELLPYVDGLLDDYRVKSF